MVLDHTAGAEAEGEEVEEEQEEQEEEQQEEEEQSVEEVAKMFDVKFDNDSDPRSTKVMLTAMDQVGLRLSTFVFPHLPSND